MHRLAGQQGRRRFLGILGGVTAGTLLAGRSSGSPPYGGILAAQEDLAEEEAVVQDPPPPPPVEERIAAEVPRRLRDLALQFSQEVQQGVQKLGNGWHVAPYDPAGLLKAFTHIRLREGYRLAAYQLVQGGNGNGFPLVIPAGSSLPAIPKEGFARGWRPPRGQPQEEASPYLPAWVRADIESFLDGDGSALSYFEASLFAREVRELGAMWHGISWGAQKIVTTLPSPGISGASRQRLSGWQWLQPPPADWRPVVQTRPSGEVTEMTVVFYTFTRLRQVRIERQKDTYLQGYQFRPEAETLAEGGPGFVF